MKTVCKNNETNKYTVDSLLEIMRILRAPDGCPWDKEQTHKSIRNNFLEEAYEAVDAIDTDDTPSLREELGDVLMQVAFHSVMADEEGAFTFEDVVNEVCEKLIYRHPHVFGNTVAETTDKVLENWEALKQLEKNQTSYTDTLRSVPKAFPALMRCSKVLKRAQKADVAFDNDKAINSLKKLLNSDDINVGKALFLLVAISRSRGVDAEEALSAQTERFLNEFALAEENGEDLKGILNSYEN